MTPFRVRPAQRHAGHAKASDRICGAYLDDGGTLTGNLAFGSGQNALLVRDPNHIGVTGEITTTTGASNAFGLIVDTSTTTALPVLDGFAETAVEVRGAGTVLTLTGGGPADGRALTVYGDGQLVLGQTASIDPATSNYGVALTVRSPSLSALTVNANITGPTGVYGAI